MYNKLYRAEEYIDNEKDDENEKNANKKLMFNFIDASSQTMLNVFAEKVLKYAVAEDAPRGKRGSAAWRSTLVRG